MAPRQCNSHRGTKSNQTARDRRHANAVRRRIARKTSRRRAANNPVANSSIALAPGCPPEE
eukprot:2533234-Lingulodinium_polyedra.AAC.1